MSPHNFLLPAQLTLRPVHNAAAMRTAAGVAQNANLGHIPASATLSCMIPLFTANLGTTVYSMAEAECM